MYSEYFVQIGNCCKEKLYASSSGLQEIKTGNCSAMINIDLSSPVLSVEYISVIHLCVQIFLKAHFSYDPKRDSLIPCREAGLPFRMGEILEVVNRDDPNWWQVSSAVLQLALGIFEFRRLFTVSQRYNLRTRRHTLQLPEHHTSLQDSNFLVRMLYKDSY